MSSKEPLIIHHAGCSDGICGATIIWLGLGQRGELLPAQYGNNPPPDEQIQDRIVWIVDFSYPREILLHVNELAAELHVLDHHKTAAANCEGLDFCEFDMEHSGAIMALNHMTSLNPEFAIEHCGIKQLAYYVQDRDLWRWDLDYSREINAWLASWPRELEYWKNLGQRLVDNFSHVMENGKSILRQQDRQVDILQSKAWKGILRGKSKHKGSWIWKCTSKQADTKNKITAWITNAPLLQSEVASELAERPDVQVGVAWWQESTGEFVYSLRSPKNGVDVSEIAAAFSGGGHHNAAGFKTDLGPQEVFERITEE